MAQSTTDSRTRLLSLVRLVREVSPRMEIQDLEVLLVIAGRPGVTPSEIEEHARISRTAASRAGYRLSAEVTPGQPGLGLVAMEADPNDRRKTTLFLTPRGQRFLSKLTEEIERR